MSRDLEQKLQEQYVYYLRLLGVLFCASAGGMRTSMATAIRMKKAGYNKGVQDIFIYEPHKDYHGMAVEVKCGGRPTPEQKQWQEELTKRGYYAIIVPANLKFFDARLFLEMETNKYLEIAPFLPSKKYAGNGDIDVSRAGTKNNKITISDHKASNHG